ncbi:MAG: hypothetical protein IID45_02655 [Planctomycetes bacterium]|nr:hypothetical protein [Planctomycetota bacterium]
MKNLLRVFWKDERGFVISAELVLVLTIGVLGMIVGLNSVASSINSEMNDISSAFGAIDQSYQYWGMSKFGHASVVGSGYVDARDYCDCSIIIPTVGFGKHHGGVRAPGSYAPAPAVPLQVTPCDNCPKLKKHHKLTPTPDPKLHRRHPPRKKPHGKSRRPGPKFDRKKK